MQLPVLTDDQRQAIKQDGTPMPIVDEQAGQTYILLSVRNLPEPAQGGFLATIPGIAAYGGGETEQEASLALCEALRGYLEAFAEH